ncbi:hypothetical protein Q2T83_14265 [Fervidibacter sacchari]|uniref:DUF1508 domain-containing protein n=1 Tax=Candidatus Fervidibacter sacchari TaxID=1448929 RepID=A0ABT2EI79_9BACT|nr:hypothetical protein [Candidatus Fervidibacter sacchari]MCS3917654.1 hypothetical protein [Candidatus Fervidibacter sacchari]WKU15485.1 hypothetical protein Q2T83_14265 [Candidatus Fervidibacter sacchari]
MGGQYFCRAKMTANDDWRLVMANGKQRVESREWQVVLGQCSRTAEKFRHLTIAPQVRDSSPDIALHTSHLI